MRSLRACGVALAAILASLTTTTAAVAVEPAASDTFDRALSSGWGTANSGGSYSLNVPERFSVAASSGAIAMTPGQERVATLPITTTDTSIAASFRLSSLPTAGSVYVALETRRQTTSRDAYRPRLRVQPDGVTDLELTRYEAGTNSVSRLSSAVRLPFSVEPGTWYRLSARVEGSAAVTVSAKAWPLASAEPTDWLARTTDTSAGRIASEGSAGLWSYLSASGTATQLSIDDLAVAPATGNQSPTASFTSTESGLDVSVDAGSSSDPDGDALTYAWSFGDSTTATGRSQDHTYPSAGTYPVTLTVTDPSGATATSTQNVTITTQPGALAAVRGAQLPVSYSLSTLPGRVRYVAPTGSDSGAGTIGSPYRTLPKAVAASAAGDSIVLRGGVYPVTANTTLIQRNRLTITAYPGETPVFDGSIAAPTSLATDGELRSFPYTPMPAGIGEGLGLGELPAATFAGGTATGQAARVGWRCVTGSTTYTTPAPTASDADGCSSNPRVITGYWPDQVWLAGNALTQVSDRSRVTPGTFWVSRSSSSDPAPGANRLYLHRTDAANIASVRVSSSHGPFLRILADGVTVRGIQIQRHSPVWSQYAVSVLTGVDDLLLQDIKIDDVAGISLKLGGGSVAGGSQLIRRADLRRMTITDAGWMGAGFTYTDDTTFRDSRILRVNSEREFTRGPQSGAIKATKTKGTLLDNSEFGDIWGHAVWFDQSAYATTIARSDIHDVSHSAVLVEISHGLTLVDNVIRGPAVPMGEEGHTTVRLGGSSGVRMVNNTILGGAVGVGVYTDRRSKTYGNGRPCSEHTVRYGQGGNSGSDCNIPYTSDFDFARPGAYSPSGATNQTPGMNWKPTIDLMLNNIIANQTGPLPVGWTPCSGRTPLCVFGYVTSPAVDVPLSSIVHSQSRIDGNVYQTSGPQIAQFRSRSGTAADGTFVAANVAALRGTAGLGGGPYRRAVEASGRSGTGLVDTSGTPTATLAAQHGQAVPVPTDAVINRYVPAGTRRFGALP